MKTDEQPPLPGGFEYRLDLRYHVTPRLLKDQPVHRWFWFPHSFSPQLIDEILKAFPSPGEGKIFDPFVGAGTTVVRAGQLGHPAVGTDLSPLSVFVSRVKLTSLPKGSLRKELRFVLDDLPEEGETSLPPRLQRAFTPRELAHLLGLRRRIEALPPPCADFFRLALLRVQQRVSRAVPDGGWFRWVQKEDQSDRIVAWFLEQIEQQISDLEWVPRGIPAKILEDDARDLKKVDEQFDLVITSPPYPNRHDYSRIFHIELLFLGLEEQEVRRFRRNSLRSHVEAGPPARQPEGWRSPPRLQEVLAQLPEDADPRIEPLLRGYFEDLFLVLGALRSRLRPGALCAFVVGNVRHAGVMIPVDEILVQIATSTGYAFEGAWVTRLRGNSAQQMKRFGREAARESVVFLRRT